MGLDGKIAEQLCSARDFIRWGTAQLTKSDLYYGHGTDNALDDATHLVLGVAGIPVGREDLLLDGRLTLQEKRRLIYLFEKRTLGRIPVPYLTGEAWFAGMPFHVDERVIIPRSPIAELISQGFEPWLGEQRVDRILDLCTGSGCIGIACAYYFEEAEVDLVDISTDALEVASSNVRRHQLEERVNVLQSDLFAALGERKYQLLISNPPYVDQRDFESMPEEFQHEPEIALTSGVDGLDITRQLLKHGSNHLTDNGLLVIEVGNSHVALEEAFPNVPFTWVDFERGGHGVLVFRKGELEQYQQEFDQ